MARAGYIYIAVVNGGWPFATFTVKHELQSWWSRLHPDVRREATVIRLPDGTSGGPIDITDELEN